MTMVTEAHQPTSSDDQGIFAWFSEERLRRFVFASQRSCGIISPLSLSNSQFLTGKRKTDTICSDGLVEVEAPEHVPLKTTQCCRNTVSILNSFGKNLVISEASFVTFIRHRFETRLKSLKGGEALAGLGNLFFIESDI